MNAQITVVLMLVVILALLRLAGTIEPLPAPSPPRLTFKET